MTGIVGLPLSKIKEEVATMEKRYILATQDHGAFIGTAAEIMDGWFNAMSMGLDFEGNQYLVVEDHDNDCTVITRGVRKPWEGRTAILKRLFEEEVIPNQDESHAVYELDAEVGEKLAGQCWCAAVKAD